MFDRWGNWPIAHAFYWMWRCMADRMALRRNKLHKLSILWELTIALSVTIFLIFLSGACHSGSRAGTVDRAVEGPVVVFGNSIAEGYIGGEVDLEGRYSVLLGEGLAEHGSEAIVVNSGRGGDTSRDGFLRLDEDVLGLEPGVVTISFGPNDYCLLEDGTPEIDEGEFSLYMGAIVDRISGAGAVPVLLSLVPVVPERFYTTHDRDLYEPHGGVETLWSTYDSVVRQVGREKNCDLVDLCAAFGDSLGVLMGADGVHPNRRGHRTISSVLISPVLSGLEGTSGGDGGEEGAGGGIEDLLVYPSPFRPGREDLVRIAYRTVEEVWVTVEVYSLAGGRAAIPVKEIYRVAGNNVEFWNGRDDAGREIPPGVYLLRISWRTVAGGRPGHLVRKLAILR